MVNLTKVNNAPYGLEHPLVTVRDLNTVGEQYEKLGFAPTAVTYHPWGTENRLVMMDGNFIELISVNDSELIGSDANGGKNFGCFIEQFLVNYEGVSLLALHSRDIDCEVAELAGRGLDVTARIDFRRFVTLPDGREAEAVVSLATYFDPQRLSACHFLCQQHRPEMVFNPAWMQHPNGARRIGFAVYATSELDFMRQRFSALYGDTRTTKIAGGFTIQTGGGKIIVLTNKAICERYPEMLLPNLNELATRMAVIGIEVDDLTVAEPFLNAVGIARSADGYFVPARIAGNVALHLYQGDRGQWV